MKYNVILKNDRIAGLISYPIDEDMPIIELDSVPEEICSGEYTIKNGVITKVGYSDTTLELKKAILRSQRELLLIAFDKYKTNVFYGIESEVSDERENIMAWYKSALELDETALENIPVKIKYYL